jgi:hypothetical protein
MAVGAVVIVGILQFKLYPLSQGAGAEVRPMSGVPSLRRESMKGFFFKSAVRFTTAFRDIHLWLNRNLKIYRRFGVHL